MPLPCAFAAAAVPLPSARGAAAAGACKRPRPPPRRQRPVARGGGDSTGGRGGRGGGDGAGGTKRRQETWELRGGKDPRKDDVSVDVRGEMLEVYYSADESKFKQELANVLALGANNFRIELGEIVRGVTRFFGGDIPSKYVPPACLGLTLSNEGVTAREVERENAARAAAAAAAAAGAPGAAVDTFTHDQLPLVMRVLYNAVCAYIDRAFDGRPIARLWYLEVVARMPYFAYTSCLHLYSTLGWWRSSELMNIHYSEQLNEAFHCAVMESLGGDRMWRDRFTAFHSALAYYWFLVVAFLASPAQSYAFSQALEAHAVDTYGQFIDENEAVLRDLPQPEVSKRYFSDFLFYFDEFHRVTSENDDALRRPRIKSLYDVFVNILEDELEHTKTMAACVDYTKGKKKLQFKGRDLERNIRDSRLKISKEERKAYWNKWAKSARAGNVGAKRP